MTRPASAWKQRLGRLVASGFGCGFAPVAPGTVGSAVALAVGAGLMQVSPYALPAAALLACLAGIWAIAVADGAGDPGWIVIDEFVGQWIAMLALPQASAIGLAASFALFRLFDIAKPGPVGWADRRKSAWGVMADDVIAGVLAALVLVAARSLLG